MHTRLDCGGRPPQFEVEFHPYANLAHTIRLREDVAYVRVSDLLRGASRQVLEAIAAILLGQLYRRRPPRELVSVYQRFAYSARTRRQLADIRRVRARRVESGTDGAWHDLSPMFRELNRRYFAGALPAVRLGWSARNWRAQLGCFDPALNQIVINRRLDSQRVPRYVVEYVLYHEMLHLKHPLRVAHCRLESHSAHFRKEEQRFQDYGRALKVLRIGGSG